MALSTHDLPAPVFSRIRECTLNVSKQLVEGELWRHGAQAKIVKVTGPATQLMYILCEKCLPAARLAVKNYGRRRGRERMRARDGLDHRWSQGNWLVRRQERTAIGQKLRCGHATMMYRSASVHP